MPVRSTSSRVSVATGAVETTPFDQAADGSRDRVARVVTALERRTELVGRGRVWLELEEEDTLRRLEAGARDGAEVEVGEESFELAP